MDKLIEVLSIEAYYLLVVKALVSTHWTRCSVRYWLQKHRTDLKCIVSMTGYSSSCRSLYEAGFWGGSEQTTGVSKWNSYSHRLGSEADFRLGWAPHSRCTLALRGGPFQHRAPSVKTICWKLSLQCPHLPKLVSDPWSLERCDTLENGHLMKTELLQT